ncbi:MAG TPA: histidine phosphatase family protein [Gemmatimonadaceae bacterium]|nr:histidine phosphatase family protein [Gemmatimonadaceae bacterium]
MTPPFPPSGSRFFLLRHGQSEANVQRLIVSGLEAATKSYGLTATGKDQVRRSVIEARQSGILPTKLHLVSSPLLRARESASIASDVLGITLRIDPRLRERGFGTLELTSDENYERVWTADREDPAHVKWGVESTSSILSRVSELFADLARTEPNGTFLLCTHGDVASVTLCAAQGVALSRHRDVGSLDNGEIRGVTAGSGATI